MTHPTQLTQSDTTEIGNTSVNLRSRMWFLTINNFTDDDVNTITQQCALASEWIWQKEFVSVPHIHLYIKWKNAKSFKRLKTIFPRANIQKVNNRINVIKYCSKDESRIDGPFFSEGIGLEIIPPKPIKEQLLDEEYGDIEWRDWQSNILSILEQTPNNRTINWIFDEEGNKGKSFLCKFIGLKYDCIICSGKTNDIFNQTLQWREKNPQKLRLPPCIIDIPRSEFAHCNYAAIEQLKNGFIYSGKYEGGKVFGLSPHVFVFANSLPNQSEMSDDRWNIIILGNQGLLSANADAADQRSSRLQRPHSGLASALTGVSHPTGGERDGTVP